MMLSTCIALLLPTILGFQIITVILANEFETPLGERIGFSFPLGAVIVTLQMFLLAVMRVPLTLMNTTIPIFIEIIGLAMWMSWKKIQFIPAMTRRESSLLTEFSSPQNHWIKKYLLAGLFLWIITKFISILFMTGLRPIYSWDAWAQWTAAAKVFFHSNSLLLDVAEQDFFGKSACAAHRIIFYPVHNPLLQVWISLWNGKFDEIAVKFFNPLYLFSMAICFYYIAMRETNRILALSLLVIILSSPLLSYHAVEMNCDLMLGTYLFLASLSFVKAMRKNNAYWILTGIFAAEALFIKEQAIFFILPLMLSAILYLKLNLKQEPVKFRIFSLLIPFLALVPWYAFFGYHYGIGFDRMQDYGHAFTTPVFGEDPNQINKYLTFHPEILTGYFYWFLSLNNFNVILFFFPILLIVHKKFTKEEFHLLFPVILYMLSYIFFYMFTFFFSFFKWGVIFFRNTLTFYPAICLLMVLLLKDYTSLPLTIHRRNLEKK
jgi:4-amino-4-deoxy-L-arabinose transferase-like glycosyltransferase